MHARHDGAAPPSISLLPASDALARLPRALAFRLDALPLSITDGEIAIAVCNPGDGEVLDELRRATRLRVQPIAADRETIRGGLQNAYTQSVVERGYDDGAPAIRAVDELIAHAIEVHASDVHIQPDAGALRIRLRIDGLLRDSTPIEETLSAAFLSRIKILAGMDIADRRSPQDGRFTSTHEQRTVDIRVSSIPTIDGEKCVLRLLDHHARRPRLDELGMSSEISAMLRSHHRCRTDGERKDDDALRRARRHRRRGT